ncbi:MAG: hypothetical protein PHR68_03800 [Candidatus Gracilibacteria bacterium]|nr:hypothetical protein [Candidatus Gracilibacteria bacterium]
MKKRLYIFLFIFSIFLVNLFLYYFSGDYRFFLKKLKYGNDTIVHVETKALTDEYVVKNDLPVDEKILENTYTKDNSNKEYTISKIDKEFSNYFSGYTLGTLKTNENLLLKITEEYPDKYAFYEGNDLNLYLFGMKSFDSMYDFFDVISYDKAISLKKLKLYGMKSFFINLDKSDGFVRFIIEYKNAIFGIKVKKTKYNLVKENILNKIN